MPGTAGVLAGAYWNRLKDPQWVPQSTSLGYHGLIAQKRQTEQKCWTGETDQYLFLASRLPLVFTKARAEAN